jgi:TonB family protein
VIDLTIGNLVAYSAQVLVVVAAGAAGARVVRMPARVRLVFWRSIAAACLLLPLVPPTPSDVVLVDPIATPSVMIEMAADAGAAERDVTQSGFFPAVMVGWILLAGAGGRAVWLAIGLVALSRLRKESRPAALAEDIEVLRKGIASHAAVRWHDEVQQPVTFGLWRPIVLLPGRLSDLPAEAQRAVVCHELLHIRRRDWAWMLGEEAVRCAFWFHPAMRYALAELQLTREQVIDEEVVRITAARQPYMNALVTFAGAAQSHAAATPFIRRRHLVARIKQLSEEGPMSRLRIVSALAILLLFVTGSAWLAAATLPLQARELTLLPIPLPPSLSLAALSAPQPPDSVASGPGEQAQRAIQRLRQAAERLVALQPPAQVPAMPSPPRVTHRVAPDFPLELRAFGVEAVVTLHLVVNAAGDVRDVDVIRTRVVTTRDIDDPAYWSSQPSRLFAQAAEAAAEQWQFAPSNDAATVEVAFVFVPLQATAGFAIGNPGQTRVTLASETRVAQAPSPDAPRAAATGAGVVGSPTPGLVPAASAPVPAKPAAPPRLRVGGQVRPPAMVVRVPPQYPAEAQQARVTGVVIIQVVIGTDGSVMETTVLRSIPLLDQAAVDAVRQWRYEPVLLNGQPVELIMTVTVNFTLPAEQ